MSLEILWKVKQIGEKCRLCDLHKGRNKLVFGIGNCDKPKMVLIGEGPGADEDREGRPFVGRAGQMLNSVLKTCGIKREEVYIANTVMCRPPGNRNPSKKETDSCFKFLKAQLDLVQPEIIVTLGAVPAGVMLDRKDVRMYDVREVWHKHNGIPLRCTYHPSYLCRQGITSEAFNEVVGDFKTVLRRLNG